MSQARRLKASFLLYYLGLSVVYAHFGREVRLYFPE